MRINCPVALRTKKTSYFFDSHFNIILQSSSRRWDSVRLRTGRSRVQIPAGQDISPPPGANAASCSIDMVGSSAVGRPEFEVACAYAKNEWSYTSTSHMPSWSAQKKTLSVLQCLPSRLLSSDFPTKPRISKISILK
jgi:hypothetical protein